MFFSNIIGQEKIKKQLVRTVQEGRISHAQLFLGPIGCGNLALAIAYAQYISCTNKGELDACGQCSSCIKFNKLAHPDLHFVFPVASTKEVKDKPVSAKFLPQWRETILQNPYVDLFQWLQWLGIENKQGAISVNESNEIIKKMGLKPYESEYKSIIIWHPEKMHISAANKLLKIIEEPPPKTLFVLVAESQDQIINTILSRTQIIKINKISHQELAQEIHQRYSLPLKEAQSIAYLSDGNIVEAQRIAQENKEENFNFKTFKQWMQLCFKKDIINIIDWVEGIAKIGRERQKNILLYALYIFRESLLLNYNQDNLAKFEGEELSFIKNFSPYVNEKNIVELTEAMNKATYHIERNAYPKILFLDLSFQVMAVLKK